MIASEVKYILNLVLNSLLCGLKVAKLFLIHLFFPVLFIWFIKIDSKHHLFENLVIHGSKFFLRNEIFAHSHSFIFIDDLWCHNQSHILNDRIFILSGLGVISIVDTCIKTEWGVYLLINLRHSLKWFQSSFCGFSRNGTTLSEFLTKLDMLFLWLELQS